jgi:hypothetical protein
MPSKCNTCPGSNSQKKEAPRSELQCFDCAKRETEAKPSAGGMIYKAKRDGKWYRMDLNRSNWTFRSFDELIPNAILEGEDEAVKKKARQQVVDFTNARARKAQKARDKWNNDKSFREESNKKRQISYHAAAAAAAPVRDVSNTAVRNKKYEFMGKPKRIESEEDKTRIIAECRWTVVF